MSIWAGLNVELRQDLLKVGDSADQLVLLQLQATNLLLQQPLRLDQSLQSCLQAGDTNMRHLSKG